MTAIDRTIYRRMKRNYTMKELIEAYTPTEEERRFVSTMTRTTQNQLNLMLWITLFPCLGYFPALNEIPTPLVDHIRKALDLGADVVPGYDHDRTLYRHHQVVREYYQILPYGKEARRVILRTLLRAVRTMDNPADMINAALEELIKQRYEMPAFSTLDRLTGRVRTLVYGRICRMVQRRMTADIQPVLEALFEVQLPSHRSAFSQLKLVPPSPTLSHLKVWQGRLAHGTGSDGTPAQGYSSCHREAFCRRSSRPGYERTPGLCPCQASHSACLSHQADTDECTG